MVKNAAKFVPLGIAVSVLLSAAFLDPATAQVQGNRHRMISLVQSQNMLAQKMSKELVLVALNIDKNRNLRNLESSRALFERTLKALRDGDGELGSSGSSNPDFLEGLGRVSELWLLYEATLRRGAKGRAVTADQVGTIADLTGPMSDAVEGAVEILHEEARQKQLISMLDTTIELLAHQAALTQQMSKEFLLIAYGHEAKKNRRALKSSMALFDRTLDGLLNGDPELQLLPAPNQEIRAQLRMVARIWDDFRPLLSTGTRGAGIDRENMRKVAEVSGPLLDAINEALSIYEAL